jgi:hypothetical protein
MQTSGHYSLQGSPPCAPPPAAERLAARGGQLEDMLNSRGVWRPRWMAGSRVAVQGVYLGQAPPQITAIKAVLPPSGGGGATQGQLAFDWAFSWSSELEGEGPACVCGCGWGGGVCMCVGGCWLGKLPPLASGALSATHPPTPPPSAPTVKLLFYLFSAAEVGPRDSGKNRVLRFLRQLVPRAMFLKVGWGSWGARWMPRRGGGGGTKNLQLSRSSERSSPGFATIN